MATITGTSVNFVKVNTQAQYNDLTKQDGTIYFVVSEKKIYLDGAGYGMSDEDAAQFLKITGGNLNGSLNIVGDGEEISFVLSDDEVVGRIQGNAYGEKGISVVVRDTTFSFIDGKLTFSHGQGDDPIHIRGVATPINDDEAVNKAFLDQEISSILNMKGANNGLAELDANGTVPSSQLPSYVDDVIEAAGDDNFPITGESGKIYVDSLTNKTYRWSGTVYVEISASLALGETQATAYRGDRGKAAYDHISVTTGNPHSVTKNDVGLGSVGNYGVASQAEAEAGTTAVKYMTPQRTKQAIEKLAPKLSWTVVA